MVLKERHSQQVDIREIRIVQWYVDGLGVPGNMRYSFSSFVADSKEITGQLKLAS